MASTKEATAPPEGAEPQAPPDEANRTIVRRQPKPLSLRDPGQLARAFAESGYWKHVKTPAQAVVIMAAGEELGLTPLASMQGITMIKENLGYRGNLLATLLRRHEHYDYRVIERTDESCTLQFLYDGAPFDDEDEGKVTFTVKDAERAKLVKTDSGWEKTPRAMCFNRCLTEGYRVYCPDLTMGTPVYSTEEIEEVIHEPIVVDAEVVEEGDGEGDGEGLPEDRIAQLRGLWEKVKPIFEADERNVNAGDGLNFMLGTLGIDGFGGGRGFKDLTPEEAVKVEAEFQKEIDKAEAAHADA